MTDYPRRNRRRHGCEYPECPAFARLGERFCHAHKETVIPDDLPGDESMGYAERLLVQANTEREERRAEFLARVAAGDYRKLYSDKLGALIESAAQEQGLDTELGALRYVLAEVVSLIEDPSEKARAASTLARAIATVSRTARLAESGLVEGLQELLHATLRDMDDE